MKISELIKQLQAIENQEREVTVLLGDEDGDHDEWDTFELHHTDGDADTVLEIFITVK